MKNVVSTPNGEKLLYEVRNECGELKRRTIIVGEEKIKDLVIKWIEKKKLQPEGSWEMSIEKDTNDYVIVFEKADWDNSE